MARAEVQVGNGRMGNGHSRPPDSTEGTREARGPLLGTNLEDRPAVASESVSGATNPVDLASVLASMKARLSCPGPDDEVARKRWPILTSLFSQKTAPTKDGKGKPCRGLSISVSTDGPSYVVYLSLPFTEARATLLVETLADLWDQLETALGRHDFPWVPAKKKG